jgi:hypothetical protein
MPDNLADAINPRDSDRPEPALGPVEPLGQELIPCVWQEHILVNADGPFVLGAFEAEAQAIRRTRRIPDQDYLVRRAYIETRGEEEVRLENRAIGDACNERECATIGEQSFPSFQKKDRPPWLLTLNTLSPQSRHH